MVVQNCLSSLYLEKTIVLLKKKTTTQQSTHAFSLGSMLQFVPLFEKPRGHCATKIWSEPEDWNLKLEALQQIPAEFVTLL